MHVETDVSVKTGMMQPGMMPAYLGADGDGDGGFESGCDCVQDHLIARGKDKSPAPRMVEVKLYVLPHRPTSPVACGDATQGIYTHTNIGGLFLHFFRNVNYGYFGVRICMMILVQITAERIIRFSHYILVAMRWILYLHH